MENALEKHLRVRKQMQAHNNADPMPSDEPMSKIKIFESKLNARCIEFILLSSILLFGDPSPVNIKSFRSPSPLIVNVFTMYAAIVDPALLCAVIRKLYAVAGSKSGMVYRDLAGTLLETTIQSFPFVESKRRNSTVNACIGQPPSCHADKSSETDVIFVRMK